MGIRDKSSACPESSHMGLADWKASSKVYANRVSLLHCYTAVKFAGDDANQLGMDWDSSGRIVQKTLWQKLEVTQLRELYTK